MQLGQKARDKISGVEGILVSKCEFINGCIRYSIQRSYNSKTDTMPEELWFDEKQLEIIGKGITVESKTTGGPTIVQVPKGARA